MKDMWFFPFMVILLTSLTFMVLGVVIKESKITESCNKLNSVILENKPYICIPMEEHHD